MKYKIEVMQWKKEKKLTVIYLNILQVLGRYDDSLENVAEMAVNHTILFL